MKRAKSVIVLAALAAIAGGAPVGPLAQEPTLSAERFTGRLWVEGAPRARMMSITITVDRWTTSEERQRLVDATRSGGAESLLDAMNMMDAGSIEIDTLPRWPIRAAYSWPTEGGRTVRFVTNRPVNIGDGWDGIRTVDYPIGVVELRMSDGGTGEGAVVAAATARFDADDRLEARSLPPSMKPHRLSDIVAEVLDAAKIKRGH